MVKVTAKLLRDGTHSATKPMSTSLQGTKMTMLGLDWLLPGRWDTQAVPVDALGKS